MAHPSTTDRMIRVFVSSTFKDMQAERDALARVFPLLRERCRQRGIVWIDVDLRWGITNEQAAERLAISRCFEEIQQSNYFIGLLGSQYGWVPDSLPYDLIAREPWLLWHRHRSITELEIVRAVFRERTRRRYARFYFRDRGLDDGCPPESADRARLLRRLKARIRRSKCRRYEAFTSADDLAGRVYADFASIIDRDFKPYVTWDRHEAAAEQHRQASRRQRLMYVPSGDMFQRLDAHANHQHSPLVITGEAGSGKSALLANWSQDYRARHPTTPVIECTVGESLDGMLYYLVVALFRRAGIPAEQPTASSLDGLRSEFASALRQAGTAGATVVVIDGLDALEDTHAAQDLTWLPVAVPASVRLIVSSAGGRSLDRLTQRNWPRLQLSGLPEPARIQLITSYLRLYGKVLHPDRVARIAAASPTANPRYLRAVLEELRVSAAHENLDSRINWYLEAASAVDLYVRILRRHEADYQHTHPHLVRAAMTAIWASRRGIGEPFADCLFDDPLNAAPVSAWHLLRSAVGPLFLAESNTLRLSNASAREAVEQCWLPDDEARRAAHAALAAFYACRGEYDAVREAPWQWMQAGEWDRLGQSLSDPHVFKLSWQSSEYDARTYWSRLETHSHWRMTTAYQDVIAFPEHADGGHLWRVERLLLGAGHADVAYPLRRQLTERERANGNPRNLRASLTNEAQMLAAHEQYDEALARIEEAEQVAREHDEQRGIQMCLQGRADIARQRQQLDRALALWSEHERLCRDHGWHESLGYALKEQAAILADQYRFDDAFGKFEEAERIAREHDLPMLLMRVIGLRGPHLVELSRLEEAWEQYTLLEEMCRDVNAAGEAATAVSYKAQILLRRGEAEPALALIERAGEYYRQTADDVAIIANLGDRGLALRDLGRLEDAQALFVEQERLARTGDDRRGVGIALCHQGGILRKLGRLAEALTLYREAEAVCREAEIGPVLRIVLRNQVAILERQGQRESAIPLWNEICDLTRRHFDRATLVPMLSGRAHNYLHLTRWQEAQDAFGEQAMVLRELGDLTGLAHALANQAAALANLDDPRLEQVQAEAVQLFRAHPLEDLDSGLRERFAGWAAQASLRGDPTL